MEEAMRFETEHLAQASSFLAPSFSTAYMAAPIEDGNGPWFVDTMFELSKHSETAQADAISITLFLR